MSEHNILPTVAEALELIRSRRVLGALKCLETLATTYHLTHYSTRLQSRREAYGYMLDYMRRHGYDPGRDAFVADTCRTLRITALQMLRDINTEKSTDLYYAAVRMQRMRPRSLPELLSRFSTLETALDLAMAAGSDTPAMHAEAEHAMREVFDHIWTLFPIESADSDTIVQAVCDHEASYTLGAQAVAALMLGATRFFDPERVRILMEIYRRTPSHALKARALMALIIIMYGHPELEEDADLRARWEIMLESDSTMQHLRTVVTDLMRTLDTDRVNRTLREELIPAVQKMKPKIDRLFQDINPDDGEDINPQWEELMEDSGLTERMRRISEMQQEGADMMMLPFSSLKGFPFFREVSNWFLPFSLTHSALQGHEGIIPESMADILHGSGMMCDSDKYSLALSMGHIPASQRDMLFSQLEAQRDALHQAMEEKLLSSSVDNIFADQSLCFVRDIYRFEQLFHAHSQFSPLLPQAAVSLTEIPFVGRKLAEDEAAVEAMADFYIRNKYYKEASLVLKTLEEAHPSHTSARLEKLGLALQHSGNPKMALQYYRMAELFEGDSRWLMRHIASVCHTLRQWDEAVEYYDRVLAVEPENISILMQKGAALSESGREKEALKVYYKVNYLRPDHLNSLRAVAWTELMSGDASKSCKIYRDILSDERADATDKVNAGHAALTLRNYGEALEHYRGATTGRGALTLRTLCETMTLDREALLRAGCESQAIDLTIDMLESGKF